jgi:predicted cobalt transporter CbtA
MCWIFWLGIAIIVVPHVLILTGAPGPSKTHSIVMLVAAAMIVYSCMKKSL